MDRWRDFLIWPKSTQWRTAATDGGLLHLERSCNEKPLLIHSEQYGGEWMFSRKSAMPINDQLLIYQKFPGGSERHLKTLQNDAGIVGKSVGQLMTYPFYNNVTLRLHVCRTGPATVQHEVKLEYTIIVEETASVDTHLWARCPSLRGYVRRRLACGNTDRVTCPSAFHRENTGNNPAAFRDDRLCTDIMMSEIFREDFNSRNTLDDKWNRRISETMQKRKTATVTITRPEYVRVSNGSLHLTAHAARGNTTQAHVHYYVAHAHSGGKFDFLYDEIEIRAKLTANHNTLSASAMLHLVDSQSVHDNAPVCSDQTIFLADLRSQHPARIDVGVRKGRIDQTEPVFAADHQNTAFHSYKTHWTNDSIVWYVDDIEIYRLTDTSMMPSARMQISVEVAISSAPHTVEATAELLIDFIVVRQQESSLQRNGED
ncbi:uncharacterized protein LOC129582601 isoform X2 [Paramacrobiotus metropolitanus]|uniref:uncharacterized protein LOC129582601 isoform X2 n=1 Tax=Paramacrobiotus metropolitanus TaxID=2943436 RepID=UPI00244564D8|nr:uncharacterized protein LOC129582601 isoform X2 [Paramacrobiotus metropolitanus]